jgi:hypothetical protein
MYPRILGRTMCLAVVIPATKHCPKRPVWAMGKVCRQKRGKAGNGLQAYFLRFLPCFCGFSRYFLLLRNPASQLASMET